jgi:hypothetical protein
LNTNVRDKYYRINFEIHDGTPLFFDIRAYTKLGKINNKLLTKEIYRGVKNPGETAV